MAHQTVQSAANAAKNYQSGVTGKAANWSAGCQAFAASGGETPMQMAAKQVGKAVTNYTTVLNNGSWAASLNSLTMADWARPTAAGSTGAQKYAMAKGAAKWQAWYSGEGIRMATDMQQLGQTLRASNTPWQQRVVACLEVAVEYGRRNS